MKTFFTITAIASCLFLVSCTAETESIEPAQNLNVEETVDQSVLSRELDSIIPSTNIFEGEPCIPKMRD